MAATPGMRLGTVLSEIAKIKPLLPTYIHLLVSAVFPIITASFASLRRPTSAALPPKKRNSKRGTGDDYENEDSVSPIEALSATDAVLFPVLAGLTLTALYFTIKWLEDPALLNKILGYYFSWIGLFFTYRLTRDSLSFARSWIFPTQYSWKGWLHKINPGQTCFIATQPTTESNKNGSRVTSISGPLPGLAPHTLSRLPLYWRSRRVLHKKLTCHTKLDMASFIDGELNFLLDLLDAIALITSVLVALNEPILSLLAGTTIKTPWYLTNLQGFAFCYGSLQFMTPGTAGVGTLLHCLLFLYDIYMVFYTPMMVTVATKLDVPIKLLFPRPDDGTCPRPVGEGLRQGSKEMKEYLKCLAKKRTMAMLGLGDIVVPGIMIAFALRFDLYQYYLKIGKLQTQANGSINDTITTGSSKVDNPKTTDTRPIYTPVRGSWAERLYTARAHLSPTLRAKSFPKPYFTATVIGYILGMTTTLLVMQAFKHAQPALLYLVPGVLISFWGTALFKGEIKLLWGYDESAQEKEAEEEEEEEEKKTKKKKKDTETREEKEKKDAADQRERNVLANDKETNEKEEGKNSTQVAKGDPRTSSSDSSEKTPSTKYQNESDKSASEVDDGDGNHLRQIFSFSLSVPKSSNATKDKAVKRVTGNNKQ